VLEHIAEHLSRHFVSGGVGGQSLRYVDESRRSD